MADEIRKPEDIGPRLLKARRAEKMSQRTVAQLTDLPQSAVTRVERSENFRLHNILEIADVLGLELILRSREPLVSPKLGWQEQRVLWNKQHQCAREACRSSLLHRRTGIVVAGLHRSNGLLYCRRCTRRINDANPSWPGQEVGQNLIEWVWGCEELVDGERCNELSEDHEQWFCKEHKPKGGE